ncbi:MAG TPA: hypothetical protein VF111_02790 [Thermoanaerobaculia bacterium]
MLELFLAFKQHLVWGLMLWVLLFTAFAALFAGGQLLRFAGGLLRVLGSIFVSPFVFLRKATSGVLAEPAQRESDQYLLNKAMLLAQAVLIVLAIGAFAATGVVGWNTLVPSAEVRNAAKEHRPRLAEQRQTAAHTAAEVTRLDNEWRSKEPVVVGAARKAQQEPIDAAQKQMAAIEKDLGTYDDPIVGLNTLDRVKTVASSVARNDWGSGRLRQVVYDSWFQLSEWQRERLGQWVDQWRAMVNAEQRLANVDPEQLRNETQPAYAEAVRARDRAAEMLVEREALQVELDEAASLKWKSAAWQTAKALAMILLFIWLSGLAIETAFLAVRVADDVRRIRETREPELQAAEPAPPAEPPPSPQLRLPIRRSNEPVTVTEAL